MAPRPADSSPLLSVIVVSYNTRDLTCAALESLSTTTRVPRQVIVVDNNSSDGSAAAIRALFPEIRLVALKRNIGFARANNLAAKLAVGRFLLLLNPDTIVLPSAVESLLAFARARPEARIWGGRTLHADGRLNPTSCWRRMTLWSVLCRAWGLSAIRPESNLFNAEAYPDWSRDSIRDVDIVTGCFFMIERSFWEQLGGFDAAFFVYGEEVDLCLRARRYGARPAITPEATIIHVEGASQRDKVDTTQRVLAARIGVARRHFPLGQRVLAVSLIRSGPMLRLLAHGTAAFFNASTNRSGDSRRVWNERSNWWNGY
jgi:GT2 family glycosyltransferase